MQYDPDDLRQLQLVELEVLLAIDELCARYDIPYFLDSGSALGAMRHGGFIPWDDDIDIGMLREDYERFVAVALD
ncbi:LicD family protein, partial [Adlercreutzia caecimuris]